MMIQYNIYNTIYTSNKVATIQYHSYNRVQQYNLNTIWYNVIQCNAYNTSQ